MEGYRLKMKKRKKIYKGDLEWEEALKQVSRATFFRAKDRGWVFMNYHTGETRKKRESNPLVQAAIALGRSPKMREFALSQRIAIKHGGWNNALIKAGLKPLKKGKGKWSQLSLENLLKIIRDEYLSIKPRTLREFRKKMKGPSYSYYLSRFKGITMIELLIKAGLEKELRNIRRPKKK